MSLIQVCGSSKNKIENNLQCAVEARGYLRTQNQILNAPEGEVEAQCCPSLHSFWSVNNTADRESREARSGGLQK